MEPVVRGLPVSGGGYFYYEKYGNAHTSHYEHVNQYMKRHGISYLTVMVYDTLWPDYTPVVCNIEKCAGGFIYQFLPYNGFNGTVRWGTNKEGKHFPFIACKCVVWEASAREDEVIAAINSETGQNFDLVVPILWTVLPENGPVQSAKKIIEGLDPSHTKVEDIRFAGKVGMGRDL